MDWMKLYKDVMSLWYQLGCHGNLVSISTYMSM